MKYKGQTKYWVDPQTGDPRYDFEDMYKDIPDPWECLKSVDSLENKIFLETIFFSEKSYDSILDIGCALGGLSNRIYQKNILKSGRGEVIALDVSNTAVIQAQIKYPGITFKTFDITKDEIDWEEKFNLITLAEVLWYLVADLETVIYKLNKFLIKKGNIAIKQHFPKNQKYFTEKLSGSINLIKLFESYSLKLINHISINVDDGEVSCLLFEK